MCYVLDSEERFLCNLYELNVLLGNKFDVFVFLVSTDKETNALVKPLQSFKAIWPIVSVLLPCN